MGSPIPAYYATLLVCAIGKAVLEKKLPYNRHNAIFVNQFAENSLAVTTQRKPLLLHTVDNQPRIADKQHLSQVTSKNLSTPWSIESIVILYTCQVTGGVLFTTMINKRPPIYSTTHTI